MGVSWPMTFAGVPVVGLALASEELLDLSECTLNCYIRKSCRIAITRSLIKPQKQFFSVSLACDCYLSCAAATQTLARDLVGA